MDGDLLGIGIAPSFAIPRRALLVPTDAGNILWECTSLVTPAARACCCRATPCMWFRTAAT